MSILKKQSQIEIPKIKTSEIIDILLLVYSHIEGPF